MSLKPRGIRNNNPGNIRWGDPWQGLVPEGQRTDSAFCQFLTPAYGIRALCMILIKYQDKYRLTTIRELVARWAPPTDHNDDVVYDTEVARVSGHGIDDTLNLHDYATLLGVVKGIISEENGCQPYDDATLSAGLQLAGVVPPRVSALATPVGRNAAVSVGTGLAGAVVASYVTIQPMMDAVQKLGEGHPTWDGMVKLLCGVLVGTSLVAGAATYCAHNKDVRLTSSLGMVPGDSEEE